MRSTFDWINLLRVLSMGGLVFYLLIASSPEFHEFAPLPVSDRVFYYGTALIGGAAAFGSRRENLTLRLIMVGVVLFVPILLYAGAVIWAWVGVGGPEFLDFFVLEAIRKVIMYGALVGMFGLAGAAAGFLAGERYG